jgi:hypothetical protein
LLKEAPDWRQGQCLAARGKNWITSFLSLGVRRIGLLRGKPFVVFEQVELGWLAVDSGIMSSTLDYGN